MFEESDESAIDAIDRLLPQTQCRQCGYAACRPYACAIASGDADINRCPPGGDAGIRKLAAHTGRPYRPLDPAYGIERARQIAVIDEALCIGCTLCIQACPVDAILGATKHMHTVIAELCTGCGLCLPPCPVDCIALVAAAEGDAVWDLPRADAARERYELRQARLMRESNARAERSAARQAKRATIQAAIARARTRRAEYESARFKKS
jgi:Na+-translocating ferredoxin:NAD+ oxidoreductase subunit B